MAILLGVGTRSWERARSTLLNWSTAPVSTVVSNNNNIPGLYPKEFGSTVDPFRS